MCIDQRTGAGITERRTMTLGSVDTVVPVLGDTGDGLRQVWRRLPQPVAVVSGLSRAGEPVGMTISSLTSVSLTPPLVLFCPAVTSSAWAAVREHGLFALNLLGRRHRKLAGQFAGAGNRFEHVRTQFTDEGVPVLTDAIGVLVCKVDRELRAGDHFIVIARVRVVHAHRDDPGLDTVSLRARKHAHAGPSPRSWLTRLTYNER
jgi:3-hydroxy-9,10-secoandrosta-1,3,5(10)-triene-9,17-dione monooxygenase reductase component